MIYFTSDLHLGHENILKHRPQFDSIEEMNETIIRNINDVVNEGDTLYLLGDVSFRIPADEAGKLIRQINGHKILVRGNHDPVYDAGIFDKESDYDKVKYAKHHFILMHYPILYWDNMNLGTIQLHGHIHERAIYNETNRNLGRLQFDVGVDANDFRPVSVETVIRWADSSPWEDYSGRFHHPIE